MALTQNIVTVHGIAVDSAYLRIESVSLLSKTQMQYSICGYKDAGQLHPFLIKQIQCEYAVGGDNPFRQAYLHAKTLPEFAGSTDC